MCESSFRAYAIVVTYGADAMMVFTFAIVSISGTDSRPRCFVADLPIFRLVATRKIILFTSQPPLCT